MLHRLGPGGHLDLDAHRPKIDQPGDWAVRHLVLGWGLKFHQVDEEINRGASAADLRKKTK